MVSISTTAVLLGVLMAMFGHSIAHAEDELPDLEVTFRGLNGQREVNLVVRNLSKDWWADETAIRVETLPPKPANLKDLFVENLDENTDKPGKKSVTVIKYTLSEDCDGHSIRAEVKPAKNWAGLPETNLANNRLQTQVCPAKGAPKPETKPEPKPSGGVGLETGVRDGPIVALPGGLETRRSVPVDTELQPSGFRRTHRIQDYGYCFLDLFDWTDAHVGWWQDEDDCAVATQTAVKFDLSGLTKSPGTTLQSAILAFSERPERWLDADGHWVPDRNSCVTTLAWSTVEVSGLPDNNGLFPNEVLASQIPFGAREWQVTEYVKQWLQGERPANGFVLRGQFEDLEATDGTSCMSIISDVKLRVSYTLPRGP